VRILPLHHDDPAGYSCVSYWVLGETNAAADRNTLIDTGGPGPASLAFFLGEMARLPKGIGKRAVEQVILTHGHSDHTGGLPGIDGEFAPDTFAWLPHGRRPHPARDGLALTVGDQAATLLHTPGHSDDSICIFLPDTGTLFSGDTLYRISDHLGAYPRTYLRTLERLAGLEVRTIYPGHGQPIRQDAAATIRNCLANVRQSALQD
jgi:glyoxylase-like metal-dependent hydrolase (beta-lactamase superfamily II)